MISDNNIKHLETGSLSHSKYTVAKWKDNKFLKDDKLSLCDKSMSKNKLNMLSLTSIHQVVDMF